MNAIVMMVLGLGAMFLGYVFTLNLLLRKFLSLIRTSEHPLTN